LSDNELRGSFQHREALLHISRIENPTSKPENWWKLSDDAIFAAVNRPDVILGSNIIRFLLPLDGVCIMNLRGNTLRNFCNQVMKFSVSVVYELSNS
jgi:hypothetical protein